MKSIVALLLVLPLLAAAESAEPATPLAKAAVFYKAWETRNLSAVAQQLHSESFKGHRRYVEIALLKLEKTYGEKAVAAMLGKSKPELGALSDGDFFQFTLRTALQVAEASPLPKENGFKPIGEISDGPRVHTLVSIALVFAEGGRRLDLQRTESLTFLRENGEWRVSSFPFAATVTQIYTDELLKAAKAVSDKR